MLAATRRWLSRNRTPIAVGVGVVGAGYMAASYLISKIRDDRERAGGERIAKENLRRRFEQNQEDCTYTVLALLPTATANILEAINTERITLEIQQMRGGARSAPPSVPDTTVSLTDDDGTSLVSIQSEGHGSVGTHASRVDVQPVPLTPTSSTLEGTPSQDGHEDGQGAEASTAARAGSSSAPLFKKKTKRQLWDELAISSITRAFTLIYTLALLTLLTRIQLNLLGRRSYLSSVVSLATGPSQAPISLENHDDDNTDQTYGGDFATNRRYLTFSWWLLNRGWLTLRQRVEAAVRRSFGHLSPRDTLSLAEFTRLATCVRDEVEGRAPSERPQDPQKPDPRWLECLLPPREQEDLVLRESGILDEPEPASPTIHPTDLPPGAPSLRHLLDETADLVESAPFTHVLTLLLDAGFALLLEQRLAAGAFQLPADESVQVQAAEQQQQQRRVLLPKTLSVLTRQAHVIGNGMPNDYLQEMERVRELESFAAIVYSSNWENEIRAYSQGQEEGAAAAAAANLSRDHRKDSSHESDSQKGSSGMAASGWTVVMPSNSASGVSDSQNLVVVDSQNSLESAWERATEKR